MHSSDITIRLIAPDDSIDELTALLHRAYARLGAMGLNYTAVDQDSDVTRKRVAKGICFVAVTAEGRICGTVVLHPSIDDGGTPWYENEGVAHFGQFAVDPELQSHGIGARLMDIVEARARELNARELCLDTAEPATHLVALYERRGYRFIEYAQWRGKKYRSVIMSKTL